ncbi:MAG: phosphoribosylglycinamide formyltransferase [Flavobacteriaceae bacterium]|nr:phosphoribosylglycinamide formyltransferase [Bacteroidia bacterium]MBT8288934.1 phosphoribosylglycinamide formyltransferase [Bacteroidia bacterium]NNF74117.1 phosphoribosylglycinamide formyltransferase [Flavobacteriaceae bacterium]NNK73665.1 phosphoribosylglycinamide formyltransferase [Flavobacteriaceae bacterium]
MKRIVIFASGSGSNAENLIRFFQNSSNAEVVQVLTNNPRAKVIDRCNRLNVSCLVFNRAAFYQSNDVLDFLSLKNPDLIVLAGFLWKIPESFIKSFPNKIINIHPALLPKYGGKGMYGMHVHNAVIANKEAESGISIHWVNEHYDEGAIIFQARCRISPEDSADDLVAKIHELEMTHFPKVVESLLFPVHGSE